MMLNTTIGPITIRYTLVCGIDRTGLKGPQWGKQAPPPVPVRIHFGSGLTFSQVREMANALPKLVRSSPASIINQATTGSNAVVEISINKDNLGEEQENNFVRTISFVPAIIGSLAPIYDCFGGATLLSTLIEISTGSKLKDVVRLLKALSPNSTGYEKLREGNFSPSLRQAFFPRITRLRTFMGGLRTRGQGLLHMSFEPSNDARRLILRISGSLVPDINEPYLEF